jgi:hypothetical protein
MARVHVTESTSDPAAAPDFVGAHWVNTSTNKMWRAKGTSSVNDWVLENGTSAFTSAILGEYKISTNTTPPPGTGYIEYNNSTQISATTITVHDETQDGINIDIFLALIRTGTPLVIQDKDDHLNYQIWEVSGTPTDNSTYWSIPVTLTSSGGTGTTNFANNHNVFIAAFGGGVELPLSLANGGDGASNEWSTNSTSGTQNNIALTTNSIRFTNTSVVITGFNAGGIDGRRILVYNNNATSNITINHLSGSSLAANRIFCPLGTNFILRANHGVELHYSTTDSHWHMNIPFSLVPSAPLISNSAGTISIPSSSTSVDGYLSAANFTVFSSKASFSGTANKIAYANGTNSLTTDSSLHWDVSYDRVGVQTSNPKAVGHFVSSTGEQVAVPLTFSASLVQWVDLAVPSGSSATQQPGRLMNPNSPSASENGSGTSSFAGTETLTYRIYPYDGLGTYGVQYTETTPVTLTGTNGVDLSWTDDNTGSESIAGYVILRDVDGGGFNEIYDVGLVTSYSDENADFTGGAIGTQYADYVADGTTRSYDVYSKKTIAGVVTYSPSGESYNLTDNSSGKPYQVQHTIVGYEAGGSARIIGAEDGTSADSYIDGVSVLENATTWTLGTTVSPTSLGYTSDGTILSKKYFLRKTDSIAGILVYSSAALDYTTTDPNDSNIYYITLTGTWAAPSTGGWVYKDDDLDDTPESGQQIVGGTSFTIYDTGVSGFTDGTTSTPNAIAVNAVLGEKDGTSLSDPAQVAARGISDYARIENQDSDGVRMGAFESTATESKLYHSGSNPMIRYNSSQLGLFNVTPITRPTTGHASATFTANAGTTINSASTFDGYTIAKVVKALRDLGILT